ncbi:MAG: hypothetical protein K2H82_10455 [Oscillospiraceae bacterium]|nr:hypothetical protein [Oscillospiraceae bacterium]
MTVSEKKMDEFLRRARQAELLMKALEHSQELDRKLLQLLEKSGNHQKQESEKIQNYQDFQKFKQQELLKLARTRQEISDKIAQIPDLELRAILERKYLACQTMAQIAEAMHFDLRTIQRKHKKALDFLENSENFQNSHIRNTNFSESVL